MSRPLTVTTDPATRSPSFLWNGENKEIKDFFAYNLTMAQIFFYLSVKTRMQLYIFNILAIIVSYLYYERCISHILI